MKPSFARFAYILAIVLVAGYALASLRGPRGVSALMEKRRQIQALEHRNAELEKEIERRRDRIQRLNSDPNEQERVIQERLKLVRPGEKVYILGDPK